MSKGVNQSSSVNSLKRLLKKVGLKNTTTYHLIPFLKRHPKEQPVT